MAQNVNILETDSVDMDFTNLTLTPITNGINVSGSYVYVGQTYNINTSLTFPAAPNTSDLHEWNLYFWETDHTWHLDIGAMQYPPTKPQAVVTVAFGWVPGKSCTMPHDNSIWHIKLLPMDESNPRPGHGVKSNGEHVRGYMKDGSIQLVQAATVQQ